MNLGLLLLATVGASGLQGSWARLQVVTAVADVPVLGEIESRTETLSLVELEHDKDGYVLQERLCAMKTVTGRGAVVTEYSKAFLKVASGARRAKLIATRKGPRYFEPRSVRVIGADAPADAPMPQKVSAIDEDRDERPGVTVKVSGLVSGEIYVAQRGEQMARGTLLGDERLVGQVRWKVEQRILGATRDVLKKPLKVSPHPSPEKNYFRMRRLVKPLTCAELEARQVKLLGR